VFARRSHLTSLVLAAALLLSAAAPVLPAPKGNSGKGNGNSGADNGNGNGNNGNGNGNNGNGNGGTGVGQNKPKHNNKPTARVQGAYEVKIVGYYSGSGTARASAGGIKISARVVDPANKEMDLQAKNLDVSDDRFSGTGTLDGADVRIDGRLDPQDRKGNDVLKRGRITFTFSANGHHSRGAGEMSAAAAGSSSAAN
jgi:hypothetical protein